MIFSLADPPKKRNNDFNLLFKCPKRFKHTTYIIPEQDVDVKLKLLYLMNKFVKEILTEYKFSRKNVYIIIRDSRGASWSGWDGGVF